MSNLHAILTGFAIISLIMFVVWVIQLETINAGFVDVAWGVVIAVLAIVFALNSYEYLNRRIIIAAMVVIWGLRLSIHLLIRVLGHDEDGRYKQLRKNWAPNINLKFFLFFQAQALLALILSMPFLIIANNPDTELAFNEWIGVAVWLIGITGETVADRQLQVFKKNPANKNKVCDTGLWYYSRHPNYFFEWIIWIGYFIMALNAPYGLAAIISPVIMFFLLTKVSGVPLTEEQIIRSKGEQYLIYKLSTSAFIPWFKKQKI